MCGLVCVAHGMAVCVWLSVCGLWNGGVWLSVCAYGTAVCVCLSVCALLNGSV